MFIQSGDMLSSLCNYQSGTNIADLFTGVPGLNTVWNGYSGCNSYSGISTGCGCNYNSKTIWGMICGTGLGFLGAIGIHWGMSELQSRQAQKVAVAKQERLDAESLDNAMNTLGITSIDSLIDAQKGNTKLDKIRNAKNYVNNDIKLLTNKAEELDNAISAADETHKKKKQAVTVITKSIADLNDKISNKKTEVDTAKKAWDADSSNSEKKANYEKLKKELETMEDNLKTKEAEKLKLESAETKAEEELKSAKQAKKDTEDRLFKAKKAVIAELEKREVEEMKKNKQAMGV